MVGFSSTSNLEAGKKFGIPTTGTAAHAFTLAYESEKEAFAAQIDTFGPATTLLVDTYNIQEGIRNAIEIGGTALRAIRIDSGDLAAESVKARHLLDSLGAYSTKIIVTSDLDELIIKDFQDSPIDGFGVGTKLVSSAPMGFVYKLVEIEGRPVAKKAKDKVSIGGAKTPFRLHDEEFKISGEHFTRNAHKVPRDGRHLQSLVYSSGRLVNERDLPALVLDHKEFKSELPDGEQKVWNGDFGPFLTCTEWENW
jgi:putative nicotinate phosphoribosyltransferase